jgi:PPOX class probable F420-dependent enzyme
VTAQEARRRFARAPIARLATADEGGRPHLVPIVFTLSGETIYSAVDSKPKRTRSLRRLANVAANPRVSVLVDHYDDDWSSLWWVRADGTGRVIAADEDEGRVATQRLVQRYAQYRDRPPGGPVLAIDVERWSGWSSGSAGTNAKDSG